MSLRAAEIAQHADFFACVQRQSEAFLQVNERSPRLASIFSTQHRWLMAHIGLSLYFRGRAQERFDGLTASKFSEHVRVFNVASRNTAASFLSEMLKYGVLLEKPDRFDRRKKLLEPSSETLGALDTWMSIHANTLDMIDAGTRLADYQSDRALITQLQPLIADGFVQHSSIREPATAFSHFMGVNNGFLVTERLIFALEEPGNGSGPILTSFRSIRDMAAGVSLSKSHVARIIREAESLSIMGWSGMKGRSPMWVSRNFLESFLAVQAAKLSIIDNAFDQCSSAMQQQERPRAPSDRRHASAGSRSKG